MYKKGVIEVCDMLDDNGRLLSLPNFKRKFSLNILPFTLYYGIISAIPRHWKENMNVVDGDTIFILDNILTILFLSRHIYRSLISSIVVPPVAIARWNNEFGLEDSQWKSIFRTPSI